MKTLSRENPIVYVMMSGGVDSSVAAYLLKKAGYKVVGVFMRNWTNQPTTYNLRPTTFRCPWRQDQADARKVARILDIPFYTFNFEKEYRKKVVDYMLQEYLAGRTPNPDVMCNSQIKFGLFLDKALELGADYVATGHYVRLRREFSILNSQFSNKSEITNSKSQTNAKLVYRLYQAKDLNKDQSYFLWRLTQDQLKYCLFPIGEIGSKRSVRELAQRANLPTFNKADSQGICFIGKIPVRQFLLDALGERPGEIVRIGDSKPIGRHFGAYLFTPGQRQGLGIGGGIPHYVLKTELKTNRVWVVPKQAEATLYDTELKTVDINWITGKAPKMPFDCRVRFRHGQPLQRARLETDSDYSSIKVKFADPQRAIAPGQSVAFYKKREMLGGGIIA